MRKSVRFGIGLGLLILTLSPFAIAASGPPGVGDKLPKFTLPVPADTGQKKYLGIADGADFQVTQIKAEVVVVEIFSMYCPYCQREAPEVNRLFNLIEKDPILKDKIRLIGIGAGNSLFEVETFKRKYDILFPLFSDENFKVHKCLGEVRTPYFIAIKAGGDGKGEVIYSEVGSLKGAEQFLQFIVDRAGLKKEK